MSNSYQPLLEKVADAMKECNTISDVYDACFSLPDKKAKLKNYFILLLNSQNPSRRYNAASFLGEYLNDPEVVACLQKRNDEEINKTVKALLRSLLKG